MHFENSSMSFGQKDSQCSYFQKVRFSQSTNTPKLVCKPIQMVSFSRTIENIGQGKQQKMTPQPINTVYEQVCAAHPEYISKSVRKPLKIASPGLYFKGLRASLYKSIPESRSGSRPESKASSQKSRASPSKRYLSTFSQKSNLSSLMTSPLKTNCLYEYGKEQGPKYRSIFEAEQSHISCEQDFSIFSICSCVEVNQNPIEQFPFDKIKPRNICDHGGFIPERNFKIFKKLAMGQKETKSRIGDIKHMELSISEVASQMSKKDSTLDN